jgi:hypothetical protein
LWAWHPKPTSALVEVETTAPVTASTLGTTTPDVLPARVGPSTSRAWCGGAKARPPGPVPRYRPGPRWVGYRYSCSSPGSAGTVLLVGPRAHD